MKIVFLALFLHDFHVRADVPSHAQVKETIRQLRDMLGLSPDRYELTDGKYIELVTSGYKKNFKIAVIQFLGNISLEEAFTEIEAIIRRTDFPSDVKTELIPPDSRVFALVREVREKLDSKSLTELNLGMLLNQLNDGIKNLEGSEQAFEPAKVSAIRVLAIERDYLEALLRVKDDRRRLIHKLAVTAETADRVSYAALVTSELYKGVTDGLRSELRDDRIRNEGNYRFLFVPQLLTEEALRIAAYLPMSYRLNFLSNVESFAKLGGDKAKSEWKKDKPRVLKKLGLSPPSLVVPVAAGLAQMRRWIARFPFASILGLPDGNGSLDESALSPGDRDLLGFHRNQWKTGDWVRYKKGTVRAIIEQTLPNILNELGIENENVKKVVVLGFGRSFEELIVLA